MPAPRLGPDPFGGRGVLISQTLTHETWVAELEPATETSPAIMAKCVNEWVGPILDNNAEERAASAGSRFGDMTKVASIPLNLYFEKFVPAKKAGDDAYVRKLLNDSDFAHLRTKEGRL